MSSEAWNEIATCRDESGEYFNNFKKSLKAGEQAKAGEFLWGALVKLLKAKALLAGDILNTHGKMKEFVKHLAQEFQDREIFEGFKKGEALHANYYHTWLDKETFAEYSEEVILLLHKLETFLLKP
ncbi:MAG: PaREP1 family protein [Candidatus Heimdallarchaeota archaeon]